MVAITSNLKYEGLLGNVRLRPSESGLPKPSVVNVTQVVTIDKARLIERISSISHDRFSEIEAGIKLVFGFDQ